MKGDCYGRETTTAMRDDDCYGETRISNGGGGE